MPDVAERILASGGADMVSMARPLLADPWWVAKARKGKAHEINTCIACNQACLDHVFQNRRASCLVNPRACHETELEYTPTNADRKSVVEGKSVSVRVDLGGRRIIKKKKNNQSTIDKQQININT